LLRDCLDRAREIHVALREALFWLARRATEQRVETRIGHGETGAIVEIAQIEAERSVRLEVDQMIENELCVFRFAIRGEPHQLVFPRVDLETGVIREGRIEQTEGMGKVDFLF